MASIEIGEKYECLLISSSGMVFTIPAYAIEVDRRFSHIDVTRLDSVGREYSPFLMDPGELRMKIVGEIKCQQMGSSGATALLNFAVERLVNQQVSSVLATLSSTCGNLVKSVEDRAASALSSLDKVEDKNMRALKRRSDRAKKHISSSAHGYAKSLQKKQSKTASNGARKPAKRKRSK